MFICIYAGSLVLTVIQVFQFGPKKISIIVLVAAAFFLLVAGLIAVQRPWPFETLFRDMLIAMACVYGGMVLGMWAQHLAGAATGLSAAVRMIVTTLSFHG